MVINTNSSQTDLQFHIVWVTKYRKHAFDTDMQNQLKDKIEQIAKERDDIKVVKIDVDKETDLARQFGIMSIPTVMVIKDGKVKNTSLGFKSKEAILALL